MPDNPLTESRSLEAREIDNRLTKYKKGQLVQTTKSINLASDIGGEQGSKFVMFLPKDSLLKLSDAHPKGGGDVYYAHVMKNPVEMIEGVSGVIRINWIRLAPPQPAINSPQPTGPGVENYVDHFKDVVYDPDYRQHEGRPTNWMQVIYDDGTKIDINVYSFDEKASPRDTRDHIQQGKIGPGRRFFPRSLNQYTTPRLWSERRDAINIAAGETMELMKTSLAAVFPIIFGVGIPAPRPSSGGMGGFKLAPRFNQIPYGQTAQSLGRVIGHRAIEGAKTFGLRKLSGPSWITRIVKAVRELRLKPSDSADVIEAAVDATGYERVPRAILSDGTIVIPGNMVGHHSNFIVGIFKDGSIKRGFASSDVVNGKIVHSNIRWTNQ